MAKRADTPHVYALIGADRFLRGEAVAGLVRRLTAGGDPIVPVTLAGGDVDLATVLDEVRTPSLLGERRLVLLDDADELIAKHRERLERFCAAGDSPGILVLMCDSLPKSTRLFKAINERGEIITVEAPKGRAVVPWLTARARAVHGRTLSADAARRLVDLLGEELGTLDAELGKLAAYVGDRTEIGAVDVDQMTGFHRQELVFRVMDAVYDGDPAAALAAWDQVMSTDRSAQGRAVGGLNWVVRRMLELRREHDRGVSAQQLAYKVYPAVDAKVMERRLTRATRRRLEAQQRDLLEMEIATKTGGSTLGVAVEKFIVKHGS